MKQSERQEYEEITVNGITYRLSEEGGLRSALVVSCGDLEGVVVIPEEMEGHKVTGLAPYAFSAKRIAGLVLPVSLRSAGRYVFYRCFALERLIFCDTFTDIGAGAFTGCRLKELEIDFYQGEQSSLKFIVDEIRYALWATLRYHRLDGRVETAKVVFPEHYEEAVENTPARIVETHYHGAGGYYCNVIIGRAFIIESLILGNTTLYFRWPLPRRTRKSWRTLPDTACGFLIVWRRRRRRIISNILPGI